jgi:hypothetical protein
VAASYLLVPGATYYVIIRGHCAQVRRFGELVWKNLVLREILALVPALVLGKARENFLPLFV